MLIKIDDKILNFDAKFKTFCFVGCGKEFENLQG